jgi:predicted CXXCH cytochrome family protein
MKTTKQLILTLLLGLFTTFAFAQSMDGTAHDFDAAGWTGGNGNTTADGGTCVVCHIAHNSADGLNAPLWNRASSLTAAVQTTYTPYASNTFNAADGTIEGTDPDAVWTPTGLYADYLYDDGSGLGVGIWTPNGESLLCLSCHDGVGNLDAFGGSNGTTYDIAVGAAKMTNALSLRADGTNEHPYSFTYSDALVTADGGGLKALATVQLTGLLKGAGLDEVQCTSCHDVHNSGGYAKLLVVTNASSGLCRSCHTK